MPAGLDCISCYRRWGLKNADTMGTQNGHFPNAEKSKLLVKPASKNTQNKC